MLEVVRYPEFISDYVLWIEIERAPSDSRGRAAKPPHQFTVKTGVRVKFSDLPQSFREAGSTHQALRQSAAVAADGGLGVALFAIVCSEMATCWLEQCLVDRLSLPDKLRRIKTVDAVALLDRVISGSTPLSRVQVLYNMIAITEDLWRGLDKSHCA